MPLYDELLSAWPSPVVVLNRTEAVPMVSGPAQALGELAKAEKDARLARDQYLPVVKADLLRRMGRSREAATAYGQALELTGNDAERAFLAQRLAGPHGAWAPGTASSTGSARSRVAARLVPEACRLGGARQRWPT